MENIGIGLSFITFGGVNYLVFRSLLFKNAFHQIEKTEVWDFHSMPDLTLVKKKSYTGLNITLP